MCVVTLIPFQKKKNIHCDTVRNMQIVLVSVGPCATTTPSDAYLSTTGGGGGSVVGSGAVWQCLQWWRLRRWQACGRQSGGSCEGEQENGSNFFFCPPSNFFLGTFLIFSPLLLPPLTFPFLPLPRLSFPLFSSALHCSLNGS